MLYTIVRHCCIMQTNTMAVARRLSTIQKTKQKQSVLKTSLLVQFAGVVRYHTR